MPETLSTIYALSSAAGRAGVSVIRISGPKTKHCVQALCQKLPKPRYASLQKIIDPSDHALIDQGLILWFPAPHSFTGEDCAEFQIHGGKAVIAKMLSCLSGFTNCRMAEAGEFARRAFDNGKLDLTQVEGLADLINADTEAQRKQAVKQSAGHLSFVYEAWRKKLIETMTLLTAAIDFSDEEDIASDILKTVKPNIVTLRSELKEHLDDGHRGEIIRDGYQVVLAGVPNVGKSSLLNALARRDAAIVSDEAGTTRDVIGVSLDLEGFPIIIMDTAGLRETESAVEKEGIRRTILQASDANMVIWLMDAKNPILQMPEPLENHDNVLRLYNKVDLLSDKERENSKGQLGISIKQNLGLSEVIKNIAQKAKSHLGTGDDSFISRHRYRQDLEQSLSHLDYFLEHELDDVELRAEDLRLAANAIGRITGHIDVEDLLDLLFSEFCIGK